MNRTINVNEGDYKIENGKIVLTSEELLQAINDTEFDAKAEDEANGISLNWKCTVTQSALS